MARSATLMTAGLLLGGLWLLPASAHACEAHAKAAAASKGTTPQTPAPEAHKAPEAKTDDAPRPLEELDQLLTAKCSCGSKADCTCKRGKCECSKCSGRHAPRQVTDALRGRPATQELQEARNDASAGIFI
ncbi:metallothionein [Corallococcus exiguus]|uniref:metallothionein n=1 Tax=Corallococcus TaxID=83461 RepID=UPI000EBD116F|nr:MULTISPECIES: metallothionein [Corallococcus]NNB88352.1 metallothionein [Corallococcus exiguus]NNB99395.1 metallothionein [Corallococcus exiguus]NPC51437.1 metallothionein [Corallococcus exiguus]RKH77425.1 metallothionein [Corallococcus sp. AB032C]